MKSKYDGALFFCKKDGILQGMMASDIDDFLHSGNEYFEEKLQRDLSSAKMNMRSFVI